MAVFTATVVRVVGRIPSIVKGKYRVDLKIDDFGFMPGLVNISEFPVNILVLEEFTVRGAGDEPE